MNLQEKIEQLSHLVEQTEYGSTKAGLVPVQTKVKSFEDFFGTELAEEMVDHALVNHEAASGPAVTKESGDDFANFVTWLATPAPALTSKTARQPANLFEFLAGHPNS